MNLIHVTVPIADPGGDNKKIFLYQAPTDSLGGGVRLQAAKAVNMASFAGAGTTFTYQLLKYSSAATPAVNGTVSDILGSATPWSSGVPQAFTVDSDYSFLDAGEWLVLDYQELTNGNPTLSSVVLHLQVGK